MTRYICDCEKLELARAYYCAACNAYKQLEAELETERRLSFRNQVAQLEAERDAAVRLLSAIRQDDQCMHWHEDIDAARGESPVDELTRQGQEWGDYKP